MNFLAHAHLSGKNNDVLLGNFVADAIKGNKLLEYRKEIQYGILLHRQIDSFTDKHELFMQSVDRVRNDFGRYSGIVIDIFYDHFLASLWDNFSTLPLDEFVNRSYDLLKRNYKVLPEAIKTWFPTFLENNWMMAYQTVDGIELVLERMAANTSLPNHAEYAVEVLSDQYESFKDDFLEFFPLIIQFLEEKYEIEITTQRDGYPDC